MLFKLEVYISLSDPDNKTTEQLSQTVATRAQSQQNDGDEDVAALAITYNVLRSLATAVTKSMTTAIANSTFLVTANPKTIMYSSAIDLYGDNSFKIKTKEG